VSRALALCMAITPAFAQSTTLISHAFNGGPSPEGGMLPAISASGRWVAFLGGAGLVPGDTNGQFDVFVHDRQLGTTKRVNLSASGAQANAYTWSVSISADGRSVAFASDAYNLVPGPLNSYTDVFAVDVESGAIQCVSVSSSGQPADGASGSAPGLSADGRFVVFSSDATNLVPGDTNATRDAFVHDRQLATTERISVGVNGVEGAGYSNAAGISADGRFVVFSSTANNLVAADTGYQDVFVRDRVLGVTERESVDSSGVAANTDSYEPSISADGRFVAFESSATNLVPGDTNGMRDVFVHDRLSGVTERISVSSSGGQGDLDSFGPASVSADGNFVVFGSFATNFATLDLNLALDVFVRDRVTGQTTLVSVALSGYSGSMRSNRPSISAAGNMIAFQSNAANLYPGDNNAARDVFVRDMCSPLPVFFADADGDSFGDAATTLSACSLPAGFAYEAGDCDDSDAGVNPDAADFCNGIDDDCNGTIDDGGTSGVTYCSPGLSTHSCSASMRGAGTPSASASSGFHVIVDHVEGARSALIEYSLAPTYTTWVFGSTSYLCILAPTQRTAALFSNGTGGACDGFLDLDWLAWRVAHPGALGHALLPGQSVYFQASYRDGPAPSGRNLSDALAVLLCP
jgi:Tol biopolymer transport system component